MRRGHQRVPILGVAAMGVAFMVSYARAKSEGLGFTPGGAWPSVGIMPREVRLVILSIGLVLTNGPDIKAIEWARDHRGRGDHHESPADPPCPSTSHPGGGPAPDRTGADVSTNGTNGKSTNGSTSTNRWAGAGRRGDGKVRVAIVGVGNCASSLVQGRYYYEDAAVDDFIPGLMHVDLGGYHVRDIEFVAAFDIDKNKVGKDLGEAIYTKPNNTFVFHKTGDLGVTVERGMVHDGLGKYLSQVIEKAPGRRPTS